MEEKPENEDGKKGKRKFRRKKEKEKYYNFSDTPDWVPTLNKWLFLFNVIFGFILPWLAYHYFVYFYYRR